MSQRRGARPLDRWPRASFDPFKQFGVTEREIQRLSNEPARTNSRGRPRYIYGKGSDDVLWGKGGNDELYGGDGVDVLVGDDGDDLLTGDAGADWLQGNDGDDTAAYMSSPSGINVCCAHTAAGGDAAGDALFNIENLIGTEFGDYTRG